MGAGSGSGDGGADDKRLAAWQSKRQRAVSLFRLNKNKSWWIKRDGDTVCGCVNGGGLCEF